MVVDFSNRVDQATGLSWKNFAGLSNRVDEATGLTKENVTMFGKAVADGVRVVFQDLLVPWLEANFSELVNLNAKTGEVADNTKDNTVPTDG